jgi:sporulation protein YlmC with PRC-barrel domain
MRFDLDSPAACVDGVFGDLADVVIDPGARRVTHLVVREHAGAQLARLVPLARARRSAGSDPGVSLDFTLAELNAIEPAQQSEYVRLGERPVDDPRWDPGIEEIFGTPGYGNLGVDALGAGMGPPDIDPHATLTYDRIPKGNVEIRRTSDVTSADGHHLGHVIGLNVDEQGRIEQLIIEHGHLWGKREIAIPNKAIDRIESDAVVLSVPADQVVG